MYTDIQMYRQNATLIFYIIEMKLYAFKGDKYSNVLIKVISLEYNFLKGKIAVLSVHVSMCICAFVHKYSIIFAPVKN